MTEQMLINLAKEQGFEAAVINTADMCFDFSFRAYCEQNLCGNFGANPFCPPLCGTPEQMKAAVLKYKTALVLKSEHTVSDFSDTQKIKAAQKEHNAATLRLINKMEKETRAVALCSPCDLELPPQVTAHCLSAYCVNVKKMAEDLKMDYDFKAGRLSLFGFITID